MGASGNTPSTVILHRLDSFMPEVMQTVVSGGSLNHLQLAKGRFQGNLLKAQFGDSHLDWGEYNLPLLATGSLCSDRITLGCVLVSAEEGLLNGMRVADATPVVLSEGSELHYRLSANTQWMALQVSRERLEQLGVDLPSRCTFSPRTNAPDRFGAREVFFEAVGALRKLAQRDSTGLATAETAVELEALLLDPFSLLLDQETFCHVVPTIRWDRHRQIVSRTMDYFEAHIEKPILIGQLCHAAGISWNTLERAFIQVYGLPPKRTLELYRLSRIRQRLLNSQPEEGTISSIAQEHGIFHLSRFSGVYRAMFGELPQETFKRAKH